VRQRFRPPQTTRYYYDYENRLRRVAPSGGPAINYRYDYSGNLVEKRVGRRYGNRTRYVYGAGVEPLAQQENGDWTDNVVVNGKIVETFRRAYGNNPNNKLFYHTDALGSVVALSNRQGRVVRTTEYDPWGKVLTDNFATGPGIGGPVSVAYEFIGGYGVRRDIDGKSIMGVRMYDAGTGRFTSEDPIAFRMGDINRFRYASNNSIRFIDPEGLKSSYPGGPNLPYNPWDLINAELMALRGLGSCLLDYAACLAKIPLPIDPKSVCQLGLQTGADKITKEAAARAVAANELAQETLWIEHWIQARKWTSIAEISAKVSRAFALSFYLVAAYDVYGCSTQFHGCLKSRCGY
jgi:RHS repeat-associated protein